MGRAVGQVGRRAVAAPCRPVIGTLGGAKIRIVALGTFWIFAPEIVRVGGGWLGGWVGGDRVGGWIGGGADLDDSFR